MMTNGRGLICSTLKFSTYTMVVELHPLRPRFKITMKRGTESCVPSANAAQGNHTRYDKRRRK